MIVCHCRNISDRDIHAAVDWMRAADPDTVITPGKLYRALGTSADCGGCLPLFLETMRANPNLRVSNPSDARHDAGHDVPTELRGLRSLTGRE